MATLALRAGKDPTGSEHRDVLLGHDVLLSLTIDSGPTSIFPPPGRPAECCITWPLEPYRNLRHVAKAGEDLFVGYGKGKYPVAVEMWLEGNLYQRTFAPGNLVHNLTGFVAQNRISHNDKLQMILAVAGDLGVEWQFDEDGNAVQCSCAITVVAAQSLARFFRDSHFDDRVRTLGEISQDIFANTARPPLDAFDPLPVF